MTDGANKGERGDDASRENEALPGWLVSLVKSLVILGVGIAIGAVVFDGGSGGNGQGESEPISARGGKAAARLSGAGSSSETKVQGDCESKGITKSRGREGTCREGGTEVVVVDRNSVLKLSELNARLISVDSNAVRSNPGMGTERAGGEFVTFELEITNKLSQPDYFDDFQDQVKLSLRGATYTQDFDVQNGVI